MPAVTSVDEWTRADTGVGAAIAAGSQLENGTWALFVIAAIRMKRVINCDEWEAQLFRIVQWP